MREALSFCAQKGKSQAALPFASLSSIFVGCIFSWRRGVDFDFKAWMALYPDAQSFIASLPLSISAVLHEITLLKQEISDLRRQLGKRSSNSSKPPSSDGLKKKPRILSSLRGRSGKKAGDQAGHKGGMLRQVAAADFAGLTAPVAALIATAPVRHLDETGLWVGGGTQRLHTASNSTLTQYRVCAKRGDMLTTLVGGVIVHDHFKPYLKLAGVAHSFCNAHHLRELKALIEIEREPWATKMLRLLQRARRGPPGGRSKQDQSGRADRPADQHRL
jgi:hypothetical protein